MTELWGSDNRRTKSHQQCPHCKRWVHLRGIKSHEENCPFAGREDDLAHTLEEGADPNDDGRDQPDAVEGSTVSPEKGEGYDPPDESVDPEAGVEEAATDGGETGLGLEGPPEDVDDAGDDQEDDVVDDDQEESDDLEECPRCGAEHDTSDLSPGTYRCDECGGRVRVTA